MTQVIINRNKIIYGRGRIRTSDGCEYIRVEEGFLLDKPPGNAHRPKLVDHVIASQPVSIQIVDHQMTNPPQATGWFEATKLFQSAFVIEMEWTPPRSSSEDSEQQVAAVAAAMSSSKDRRRKKTKSKDYQVGPHGDRVCVIRIIRTFKQLLMLERALGLHWNHVGAKFPADIDGTEALMTDTEMLLDFVEAIGAWVKGVHQVIDVKENETWMKFLTPIKSDIDTMNLSMMADGGLDGAWPENTII